MNECPLLTLLPVRADVSPRTIQVNFESLVEWTRRMCQYVDELKARIAALEAGP